MTRLARLIACLVAGSLPAIVAAAPPRIALIIDDMGVRQADSQRALRLPAGVTYSFIPFAPYTEALAPQARSKGHELMIHLPMESLHGPQDEHDMLYRQQSDALMLERLQRNLAKLPGAVGINNHEGSALTADARAMRLVMASLREHDLYFVDSRTTADTLAATYALQNGIPQISRDVFLDNQINESAIANAFEGLVQKAVKQGHAVGICHPHSQTLTILEQKLRNASAQRFTLVPVSTLISDTNGRSVAKVPGSAYLHTVTLMQPPETIERAAGGGVD